MAPPIPSPYIFLAQFLGPPFDLRQCDIYSQHHRHLTTDNHFHQRVRIVYLVLLLLRSLTAVCVFLLPMFDHIVATVALVWNAGRGNRSNAA